jgi:hypothetical protein
MFDEYRDGRRIKLAWFCAGQEERTEMKLNKRIEGLERMYNEEYAALYFADGITRELRGPRGFLVRLLRAMYRPEVATPQQAEELELIRDCIGARESNGAHLVELARVMMLAREAWLKADADAIKLRESE